MPTERQNAAQNGPGGESHLAAAAPTPGAGPRWNSTPQRRRSAWRRVLPDFLIIGAMKAGTTTLYDMLRVHPRVLGAFRKEVHYFDLPDRHARGEMFYRSFFPTRWELVRAAWQVGEPIITGEASPFYLYHPHAPRRVYEALPHVRLIALLRDPVERAYSHYQHALRHGWEDRSFGRAVEEELADLGGLQRRVEGDETLFIQHHQLREYVHRGQYAEQLARWSKWFSREQLLVLRAEDLFAKPAETLRRVEGFLGLPEGPVLRRASNTGNYDAPIDPASRDVLERHYQSWNLRLAPWLGTDRPWTPGGARPR